MKNITLITGFILLATCLLFGLILSIYPTFNMLLNCVVIVANTALVYAIAQIGLKDAFKISLSFLFVTLALIEFVLGLFSPQKFEDNFFLLAIILIVAFKAIVLGTTYIVSKKIE